MKFDALVKQLDTVGLEELRRTVAIEIEDRGGERQNAPAMDSIRPRAILMRVSPMRACCGTAR